MLCSDIERKKDDTKSYGSSAMDKSRVCSPGHFARAETASVAAVVCCVMY